MKLGDLLAILGPEQVCAEVLSDDGSAVAAEVVIFDEMYPVERGQMVLAVGVPAESPAAAGLVSEAADAGAAAVVFRASGFRGPTEAALAHGVSVLRADPRLGWAQLVTLLRTLLSATAADPEFSAERLAPSSVYGLADTIAALVGGSVVLYDRAHRVVAYSVQGYEIDDVRRDTIFGRLTPEQWIERFTIDRSAYETIRSPGSVVRVDGYPGLRARLRVAICSQDEILGEISVAEDRNRLGDRAEAVLVRAAQLAVPFMVRHRLVEDTDRATRTRMLRGLLYDDGVPVSRAAAELGLSRKAGFAVVGFSGTAPPPGGDGGAGVVEERLVHLLSLQMSSVAPEAGVLPSGQVYYALVPVVDEAAQARLPDQVKPALRQLQRMGISMYAAVGSWVRDMAAVPAARQVVDDVLHVTRRSGCPGGVVVTAEEVWPDLALLPVERAIAGKGSAPCAQLQRLMEHDGRHQTEYVKTLRVYLEEFGSVSKTAQRLVLHSNTLRHRLQRIGQLSGLDLSDQAQRLAVMVQLRVFAPDLPPGRDCRLGRTGMHLTRIS